MKFFLAAIAVLAYVAIGALGQTPGPEAAIKTTTIPLDRLDEQQPRNVKTEWVTYKGRKALRVIDTAPPDVADGIQLVILNKTEFRDGTIEIELTGEPSPTAKSSAPRGFVGVAFPVNLDAAQGRCKVRLLLPASDEWARRRPGATQPFDPIHFLPGLSLVSIAKGVPGEIRELGRRRPGTMDQAEDRSAW